MGSESLRDLDDSGDFRLADSHRDRVPGAHLPRRAHQHPHEGDAPRGGGGDQAASLPGQLRVRAVEGEGEDGEDDGGHRAGIHHLLGAVLHRAALVRLGRRSAHPQ